MLLAFMLAACTSDDVRYITATPNAVTATPTVVTAEPTIEIEATESATAAPTATIDPTPTREVNAQFRISLNVNARAVDNWDYFWQFVEDIQPASLLFMDGILEACDAAQRFPDMIIIHRNFSGAEGDEWFVFPNEHEWVARWQSENAGLPEECQDIIRYATNEASFGDIAQYLQSEVELMDAAASVGIRVVVGNFGVGRIPDWAVNAGLFDEWLRAVVRDNHIIGAHEYAQPIIPNGVGVFSREQMTDANAMHPRNWPTELPIAYLPFSAQSIDDLDPITSPFGEYQQALSALDAPILSQSVVCGGRLPSYWHVLRTTWLLLRAECIGLDADSITIINTEGLWDRTDDLNIAGVIEPIKTLEQQFGLSQYLNDMRGVNTYIRLYETWYPFWTPAEAIVCQLVWWDYIAPHQYNSVNLFTWSRNRDWWSFDLSGAEGDYLAEVHDLLIDWSNDGDMQAVCGDYIWAA